MTFAYLDIMSCSGVSIIGGAVILGIRRHSDIIVVQHIIDTHAQMQWSKCAVLITKVLYSSVWAYIVNGMILGKLCPPLTGLEWERVHTPYVVSSDSVCQQL